MAKVNSGIGFVGVVVVAFANVAATWAQSDELPRGLRERISRTLVDEGFPSAADAFSTEVKITASDGAFNDVFGISVAISGDTAIVGARRDDDNGFFTGSAHVYRRDQGGVDNWGQVTKITASDGAAGDEFGFSVAISGDTAIVGADRDDDNGGESGSAYVYFTSAEPAPDDDRDGVANGMDRCPDTPEDIAVDEDGCAPVMQPEREVSPPARGGGGLCGTMGMLNLGLMFVGLVSMRAFSRSSDTKNAHSGNAWGVCDQDSCGDGSHSGEKRGHWGC